MKKLEDFAKKILSEADDGDGDGTWKPPTFNKGTTPTQNNVSGVDAEAHKLFDYYKGSIDSSLKNFQNKIKDSTKDLEMAFKTLAVKQGVIPNSWKQMIMTALPGLDLSGQIPMVGLAGIHDGKVLFVAGGRGMTKSLGKDGQSNTSVALPKGGVSSLQGLEDKGLAGRITQAISGRYDTSKHDELTVLVGAKLLGYAINRSRQVAKEVGEIFFRGDESAQAGFESFVGPLFNNLLAYSEERGIGKSGDVTPEEFLAFFRDTAEPGDVASILSPGGNKDDVASAISSRISTMVDSFIHDPQTTLKRVFNPAVYFSTAGETDKPNTRVTAALANPPGFKGTRMYVSFQFVGSSYHQAIDAAVMKFMGAGGRIKSGEAILPYLRRVESSLGVAAKKLSVVRGKDGLFHHGEEALAMRASQEGEAAEKTAWGRDYEARLAKARELARAQNATTAVRTPLKEAVGPDVAEVLVRALNAISVLRMKMSKAPFINVSFEQFEKAVRQKGSEAFLQENKVPKSVRSILMERAYSKKKKIL